MGINSISTIMNSKRCRYIQITHKEMKQNLKLEKNLYRNFARQIA